jgi:predicted secreted protein
MATHIGNEGVVKIGVNSVAEVRSYTLNQSADTVEDTVMGDSDKTFLVTQKAWEGSADVYWDETDTNGQQACSVGSSVTLNLYPEGSGSGDTYYTGTALITGVDIRGTHNGMVESSIKFQGTGALSKTTV